MGLFSISQSLGFAGKIFDTRVTTEPIIEFPSLKPHASFKNRNDLPRCAPEQEGIPSAVIQSFLQALAEDRTLNMHGVTIARNGKIICEASFGAHRLDIWQYTFSACKSITALAIGILADDGIISLNDRVVDIFPKEAGAMGRIKFKDLTIEDLLTMRSGVFFTELDSLASENWLEGFFDAPLKGEVGKTFRYNSMNTYVLSAIVAAKAGKSLSAFLSERLFRPLGIKDDDWYWEPCPKGIEKGGWGLFIRPDDFVKIAQLVMQKGVWNGTRLISEEYVTAAKFAHVDVTAESELFDYGYQIWVGKNTNTFLFNGLFGQNVLGFRRNGIIVVSSAGNCELFQQSNFFKYVLAHFDKDFAKELPPDRKNAKALDRYIASRSLYSGKAFAVSQRRQWVTDHQFVYSEGHEKAVGLLPLILQAVENRYTSGFSGLAFSVQGDALHMRYQEKETEIDIRLGTASPAVQTIQIGEIPFTVSASAKFTYDEDDRKVVIIRIDFLEYPSSRVIKLIFLDSETVLMKNEEHPGDALAKDAVGLILGEMRDAPLVTGVMDKIGTDYFMYKAEQVLSPKLILKKLQ